MNKIGENVQILTINSQRAGQRIDNYLIGLLKGVPKSRIYRIVRKGEVRVNKKRIKAEYRLKEGDLVRVPPIRLSAPDVLKVTDKMESILRSLCANILFENHEMIVLNKPAGLAVHTGSGLNFGLIELLKSDFSLDRVPQASSFYDERHELELVHRLDLGTSGCLLIAKGRQALLKLQDLFKSRTLSKQYTCLLFGRSKDKVFTVQPRLLEDVEISGEKMVVVDEQGKTSCSEFSIKKQYKDCALANVKLITGRKHQIRVHSRHIGLPIVGDKKYGDKAVNTQFKQKGLNRLFLHAHSLQFKLNDETYDFNAPLPEELEVFVQQLE